MENTNNDREYESFCLKTGIGGRLREERRRLKISHSIIAEKIFTTKKTVINWENGQSTPNAEQLVYLERLGYDVSFVLVGVRQIPIVDQNLMRREQAMLDNYRHMSEEDKRAIEQDVTVRTQSAQKATGKKRA